MEICECQRVDLYSTSLGNPLMTAIH